jgi:hypothetical protein
MRQQFIYCAWALLVVPSTLVADVDLSWRSIDGGGGSSSAGPFELDGTIGQPDAGFMTGGSFELSGGFHSGLSEPAVGVCGDFDFHGDVELSELAVFLQCFGGASNPMAPTCPAGTDADCDGDGDVDLGDFAVFSQNFTGAL